MSSSSGSDGGSTPEPADPLPRRPPRQRWQFGLAQLLGVLTWAAFVAWLYSDWLRRYPLLTLVVIAVSLLVGLLPYLISRAAGKADDPDRQRFE